MADEPTGGGNPNVFKTFKGRYILNQLNSSWTHDVIMLSCVNDVQFLGNCTTSDDGVLAQIPVECRPVSSVTMVVPTSENTSPGSTTSVITGVTAEKKTINIVSGINKTTGTIEYVSNIEGGNVYGITNALASGGNAIKNIVVYDDAKNMITDVSSVTSSLTYVDKVNVTKENVVIPPVTSMIDVITIDNNGIIMGKPATTYLLCGLSFNISHNWY